jgi:hypothetical protein
MVFAINCTIAKETSRKQTNDSLIELEFPTVVQELWDLSLPEISKTYPGGHLNVGDPTKRVVSNYLFEGFFTDLKVAARLSFHRTFRTNYVQKVPSKLIKSITICVKSEHNIHDILDATKIILKNNFPKGGPSIKNEKQVGYFIPIDSDFNGIIVNWSINENSKGKYLQFVIQETKY